MSQDTIYFNVLLLLLARGFHCRLLSSATAAAVAVEADSAIQTEHTYPLYLSVLFNAQQRSDVSCARFLKCTISPCSSRAAAATFASSPRRRQSRSDLFSQPRKKDACTIHSFALGDDDVARTRKSWWKLRSLEKRSNIHNSSP